MTEQQKKHVNRNPVETANFFSRLFFCWVGPFLRAGFKRPLQQDDIYHVLHQDSTEHICDRLEREWQKELDNHERRPPSLFRAIFRTFGKQYLLLGLFVLVEETVKVVQPLLLVGLVAYFHERDNIGRAYAYAAGVSLSACFLAIFHHPYFFGVLRLGMWIRIACSSLIYKKSLKLSNTAFQETTTGQIVNLMSNDVSRFDTAVLFLHFLWIGPVQALVVLGILWSELGPSCLGGMALLILLVPLQSWMGNVFSRLRQKTAEQTDKRVQLMNEIIPGMRVIKMYCWEKLFANLVKYVRSEEMKRLKSSTMTKAINVSPYFCAPKLFVLLIFVVYCLLGNRMSAEKAFLCVAMVNAVRLTVCLFMPYAIQLGSESKISMKRIGEFLLLPELDHVILERRSSIRPKSADCKLEVTDLTATYDKQSETPHLRNVSVSVKPGELVAVIGPVGSGKSSLLLAVLGELIKLDGKIDLFGHVAYASQSPWVFSATLRENVLFGQEFDEARYDRVIRACALKRDIDTLPDGDQTLVGERGVSLSGGQRARVNLARAVYRDSDIYLLDDPLSAVDTAVGKHLFEQCISGLLSAKPRILITHQLQYLRAADRILIMKAGSVAESGTYAELARSGVDFGSLLKEVEPEEPDLVKQTRSAGNAPRSPADNVPDINKVGSLLSVVSMDVDMEPEHVAPAEEEERADGDVGWLVYLKYFLAAGSCLKLFAIVFFNLLAQVAYVLCDWWLSYWSNQEVRRTDAIELRQLQAQNSTPPYDVIPVPDVDVNFNIYILAALSVSVMIFGLVREIMIYLACLNASKNLHNRMFARVMKAPILFFDTNPIGRVLARFSHDLGRVDDILPDTWSDLLVCFFMIAGVVLVAGIVNPWVFIPVLPLSVMFVLLRRYYLHTARAVKRIEMATRGPVLSHLSASLTGLHTVRAYGVQDSFIDTFYYQQDRHTEAWYMFLATTRWFGIRLDWLCAIFITVVSFASVLSAGSLDAGLVGLSVTYAIALMGMFQWAVRQSAEVENQMVSVERILQYDRLDQEREAESLPEKKPSIDWPQRGALRVVNTSFKYTDKGPYVLHNLNFIVRAKEKVGIVGRTGAGKSSLIAMLFRLCEPEGHIYLDNVKITDIGLEDLRRKISIIPQDPVLFNGTMRRNLDPFNRYSDENLWKALAEVELKQVVCDQPGGLDSQITSGGSNYSVGQRQLICLARALLRNNRVLVIDEATANVDPRTDSLIQQTIREKFKHCTVLTIAHRLHTIMDSHRVMVLEAGKIVEFDLPQTLLMKPDGHFTRMVDSTGADDSHQLRDIAESAAQTLPHLDEEPTLDSTDVNSTEMSPLLNSNSVANHSSNNIDLTDLTVPSITVTCPSTCGDSSHDLNGEADLDIPKINITSPSYQDIRGEIEEEEEEEHIPKAAIINGDVTGADDSMDVPKITVTSPSIMNLHESATESESESEDLCKVPAITVTSPSTENLAESDSEDEASPLC